MVRATDVNATKNVTKTVSGGSVSSNAREDGAIFAGLSEFGLDGAERAQVFGNEAASAADAERQAEDSNAAALREIERGIYEKSFTCPVCGVLSKVPAVRSSFIRLIENDTDFMPVYKDPNPLYYFVALCKLCGFAAMPLTVKTITQKQKKLIQQKIGAAWKFDRQYPAYYTPQTAIEIHKLALYNAVVAGEKESVRAVLSLHTGWLYRILKDETNEKIMLRTACEGFERSFNNESGLIGGLDKSGQQYLIGELLRRTGNMTGALNWFKLVLIDRDANNKIKNLARNQKDRITAYYASGGKFR